MKLTTLCAVLLLACAVARADSIDVSASLVFTATNAQCPATCRETLNANFLYTSPSQANLFVPSMIVTSFNSSGFLGSFHPGIFATDYFTFWNTFPGAGGDEIDLNLPLDPPGPQIPLGANTVSYEFWACFSPLCIQDYGTSFGNFSFNGSLLPGTYTFDSTSNATLATSTTLSNPHTVKTPEPSTAILLVTGIIFAFGWWLWRQRETIL